ncbi:hypothetical protein P2H44_06980 [Albimonas sp. CAU 1670]|uniref:hypothetical protein n=1 Tax=Albimonas sp. CAU 1670 TaxID=3032599 RepID=UPI0023DB604E|nr:hypothetical protein [Albimonas sp. CAU 1670]MDF2232296.1 hypothetical protein [Albimonas sp. CAU 1670]
MRPLRPELLAALLAVPAAAAADCAGETFLSCAIDAERRLEVCIDADAERFRYAFGPADAPELTLEEPFSAGTVTPWNGVGRAIWESVAFRNGAYVYEAWHALDRLTEDPALEGGVDVLKGETLVASLTCRPGPDATLAPIFALEDAMHAAGYCRDREANAWRREGCGRP